MIKYLLPLILISNITLADDVVYLDKDAKSPYAGYLMPQEKLVEFRNTSLERDTLQLQNDSLNRSLKLQDDVIAKKDQQIQLYSDQNDKLAKTAYSEQSLSTWEKIGFIALGVVITGLAVKGVHEIYK
jgi:hypothetical protein